MLYSFIFSSQAEQSNVLISSFLILIGVTLNTSPGNKPCISNQPCISIRIKRLLDCVSQITNHEYNFNQLNQSLEQRLRGSEVKLWFLFSLRSKSPRRRSRSRDKRSRSRDRRPMRRSRSRDRRR